MRRIIILLFALSYGLADAFAQQQYVEGVTIESHKFSVRPAGLRSVRFYLNARVNNENDSLLIKCRNITLYKNGEPFASGTCPQITLQAGRYEYNIRATVYLSEGVSTWNAMMAALFFDAKDYSVDFSADVFTADGETLNIVRKEIPLTKYLSN